MRHGQRLLCYVSRTMAVSLTHGTGCSVRIRQGDNKIDPNEWRFLLTGPIKKMATSSRPDVPWLTDAVFNELLNMNELPRFAGFVDDVRPPANPTRCVS